LVRPRIGKGGGREEAVISAENTAGVQEVKSSIRNRLDAIVVKEKSLARTTIGAALMIWMVEKKVFQIVLNLGFESVKIPVRVKLEFEVKEGNLVPDSLTKNMLYNRQLLERRYSNLDQASLQRSIERKVESQIQKHLQEHGFIEEKKREPNLSSKIQDQASDQDPT